MYPELFSVGNFTIYTYGVCVALGFFFGMQYAVKNCRNVMTKQQMYDFIFYVIIAGIIGARLFYIFTNFSYYLKKSLEAVQVWNGGLVYYGGFICVLIFAYFYCRKKNIDLLKLADILSPALALGHVFGRIGCFFSGCCYGKNTDFFLALSGRHPVQLYEATGNLIIFFILNKILKNSKQKGSVFILYMILYSVLRFCIELLRGDDRGAFLFGLSPAQNISILIFIAAVFMFLLTAKKR